jgi:hypothetical protein
MVEVRVRYDNRVDLLWHHMQRALRVSAQVDPIVQEIVCVVAVYQKPRSADLLAGAQNFDVQGFNWNPVYLNRFARKIRIIPYLLQSSKALISQT